MYFQTNNLFTICTKALVLPTLLLLLLSSARVEAQTSTHTNQIRKHAKKPFSTRVTRWAKKHRFSTGLAMGVLATSLAVGPMIKQPSVAPANQEKTTMQYIKEAPKNFATMTSVIVKMGENTNQMSKDVTVMKNEMARMRYDITQMQESMNHMNQNMVYMNRGVGRMSQDVNAMSAPMKMMSAPMKMMSAPMSMMGFGR